MHRSRIFLTALTAALVWIGAGCEGAGPFASDQAPSDPAGLPGPVGPVLTGTAEGKVLGHVKSIDPSRGTLTLAGNVRLQLTLFTEIDKGGDFDTLAEVRAALAAGTPVLCDVDGFLEGGVLIVLKIRFVNAGSCDSCGSGAGGSSGGSGTGSSSRSSAVIDGHVQTVDLADGSITLVGGFKVWIHSGTEFQSDDRCGCRHLDDVKKKMDAGFTVNADVRGEIQNGGATATRVRFEIVGGETDDDGDEAEDEPEEMKSTVLAVDLAARIVTLENGKKLRIASDALIEAGGDFRTLAEVKAAVDAGIRVRIEADVIVNLEGFLEVTGCRFDKDEADAGDDDDGQEQVAGIVASVDLLSRTCRTSEGKLIRVASDSIIDLSGDVFTLADVALRLTLGIPVRVQATGTPSASGLIATKVKFWTD